MSQKYDKSFAHIEKKLEHLGLSEKAAKVYIDLLGREQFTGTSKITRATKLHGQYVYDALAELEEKGLASHVVVGKRKKFAATHPSRLEAVAEQQRRLAKETAHDLSTLLRRSHVQDFELYQGDDAFVAHEFDELSNAEDGEEWLIVGGSGDKFHEIMRDSLKEYDALRLQKKIRLRYIGSQEQVKDLQHLANTRPFFNARILNKFDKSIVNTLVRPASLALSTYADPVLTYKVRSKDVATSYKNFFEALWGQCKEI